MIIYLQDRYIKGKVSFEDYGDNARMSYVGKNPVPLNSVYEFNGTKWRVVKCQTSEFNPQYIMNVYLERVLEEK